MKNTNRSNKNECTILILFLYFVVNLLGIKLSISDWFDTSKYLHRNLIDNTIKLLVNLLIVYWKLMHIEQTPIELAPAE